MSSGPLRDSIEAIKMFKNMLQQNIDKDLELLGFYTDFNDEVRGDRVVAQGWGKRRGKGGPWPPPIKFSVMLFFCKL